LKCCPNIVICRHRTTCQPPNTRGKRPLSGAHYISVGLNEQGNTFVWSLDWNYGFSKREINVLLMEAIVQPRLPMFIRVASALKAPRRRPCLPVSIPSVSDEAGDTYFPLSSFGFVTPSIHQPLHEQSQRPVVPGQGVG